MPQRARLRGRVGNPAGPRLVGVLLRRAPGHPVPHLRDVRAEPAVGPDFDTEAGP